MKRKITDPEELEQVVDAWHDRRGEESTLPEELGWTGPEFTLWMTTGKVPDASSALTDNPSSASGRSAQEGETR